ncbi:MAG: hypothetical protein ABJL44_11920 [Algibacter sp.]
MIYLTVLIFVQKGKEDTFNTYESSVLPILSNYKGTLIYRIKPTDESFINTEGEKPYEIHFISFESNKGFSGFLNDEKRKDFEHLKEDSITSTFIVKGEKL